MKQMIKMANCEKNGVKRVTISISEEVYEKIESAVLGFNMMQALNKEPDIEKAFSFIDEPTTKEDKKKKIDYVRESMNRSSFIESFINVLEYEDIVQMGKNYLSLNNMKDFTETFLFDLDLRTSPFVSYNCTRALYANDEVKNNTNKIVQEFLVDKNWSKAVEQFDALQGISLVNNVDEYMEECGELPMYNNAKSLDKYSKEINSHAEEFYDYESGKLDENKFDLDFFVERINQFTDFFIKRATSEDKYKVAVASNIKENYGMTELHNAADIWENGCEYDIVKMYYQDMFRK